jgi:phosphate transport system ATP-binding protein
MKHIDVCRYLWKNTNVDVRVKRDGFKTNPFPKTIYENVAYGLRVNGITDKTKLKSALLLPLNKWRFGMRLKTN